MRVDWGSSVPESLPAAMAVQEVLRRALGLGESGDWARMVETLEEALRQYPEDGYLLGWLGVAFRELGNEAGAHVCFRRCLATDPLDPHLLALAGSGLAYFGDHEAEAALRAAALSGPDVPVARLQYGAYLARAGLLDEALEHLEAAVRLAPDDAAIRGEVAGALALSGNVRGAISELERTLDMAPDDSWSRLLLGLLYAEAGLLEEAADSLVRAADEREDDLEAQVVAALAAAAAGWEQAAHSALAVAEGVAETTAELQMTALAEGRILEGADSARAMLFEGLGPSVLRERLMRPL